LQKPSFTWVPCLYESKRKTKMTQAPLLLPPRHQESRGQLTEGCTMPVILRPSDWVQRASTYSSVRSVLHPDPSSSSSVSNSEKCNRVVGNANRVPQRTPLAATTSVWSSSSSAAEDSDTAKEDIPSALSSSKSRTWAAELRRATSSASTSHRAACSTSSLRTVSSSRSACQTRSIGDPRIRSQTFTCPPASGTR
jgi:hypothetical protein